MPSRLPQHKDSYAEALETPQPPVNPECCTEKERLLNVWKRVALEIAEYAKTIVDERILTRGEYDSRKAATKRLWKACESARNTFQTHRSEHGC
jgi:hypothetical protein